jgi:hypothetical protein
MRKRLFFLLNIVLVMSLVFVSPAAAKDTLRTLKPGQQVTFEQRVPINIVFIGYDNDMVDRESMLAELPASYTPVVRYPQFYGISGREMGLQFNFDYNVRFVGRDLSNRFFNYLTRIGTPGDPTDYQVAYNEQENNVLDVAGPVLYIDGPSVERWLANQFERERGYTIVFINWHSRPDFQFHVYTKTDEPDPDTGYNFGEIRATRKMIAWGGSHSRLWFYDLSAGPEAWTDNWNVDMPDLDGNGAEDYRMPPIWEYTEGGYRDPSMLSRDLGWITRFVGINLLFTSSPLYDPLITAPGLGGDRVVHITMFEDDENSLGTDWINTSVIQAEYESFQPYYDWEVHLTDVNPIDDQARRALRIFAGLRERDDCWNDFGTPFAQLFCYFNANLDRYVPAYDEEDYVTAIFAFNTTEARLGSEFGLLGFADDDWLSGTQTFVFQFDAAEYRELGYGFTSTTIHEGGHHFAMSHPHDGYDSELGIDYGPADQFYFAWSGDESDTVMSYLGVSNTFSQFDMDNMYRWEMAGYLNWSNELLAEIQAHPDANTVRNRLNRAESLATQAVERFRDWRYLGAVTKARQAYLVLLEAADILGIEPAAADAMLQAVPSMMAPHFGDPIRFPDN